MMISLNFQDPAPNNFLGQHSHPSSSGRLMSRDLATQLCFQLNLSCMSQGGILYYPINTVCRFALCFWYSETSLLPVVPKVKKMLFYTVEGTLFSSGLNFAIPT